MNNITDKTVKNCTSCQLCFAVCPTEAIRIELDKDGFYVPVVDDNMCISCGLCKESCYKYDEKIIMTYDEQSISIYAVQSIDKKILNSSTSGGVASHIAIECLKQGYKVIGVAYDNDRDIAINKIATNEKEIESFKGSKYMQSYTEKVFKVLLKDQTDQKYVVFGTSCQIYAIKKYAERTNQNGRLLLIDIFCHGCPSLNLWTKYVKYIKQKMNVDKFDGVEFRSKIHGWHEFSHYFISDNIKFKSKKINDPFFTFFFDNNVLCKACYDCKSRSTLEYTDIRLGDFWGAEYALNTEGVSAVVLSSDRGKGLFDNIKNKFILKSILSKK
ncbi:Coenzyme F420 hydrogenase/dehydrogenase, beta subunit C-terminal domain [Clostridium estertheticum]|uniref:4Fe-4S dicluster domain-containing protein n=2 Tax=Clostridium estertheticum TaxID=238834 RepID=A0A7Y3SYD2_9CLOT|nr:Coenzyme F420 hydrogenase/dehydrogenase, beta subunit C-terminal domain [Clostridium estertheticum]NNU77320.1 4Fe-4S dicluster domain-containing protein [Clostridium estertheticum]